MSKIGDYVIVKGQRKALYVKEGGVIIDIQEPMAIVTDGEQYASYYLSDIRPFKPSDNTLLGCHLVVVPEVERPVDSTTVQANAGPKSKLAHPGRKVGG